MPDASALRLLRPRGDAPPSSPQLWRCRPAAPPARRCAPRRHRLDLALAGCSARAEMRRPVAASRRRPRRLLRPRGDAPHSDPDWTRGVRAAPPARRCAPDEQRRRGRRGGCSARAEMRPRSRRPAPCPRWLLRPRGDAPARDSAGDPTDPAAPPARRCAAARRPARQGRRGCSARAEMRPLSIPGRRAECWLLRPRGDAPSTWSHEIGPYVGCSARAEMRLGHPFGSSALPRLLRPRGDAPVICCR